MLFIAWKSSPKWPKLSSIWCFIAKSDFLSKVRIVMPCSPTWAVNFNKNGKKVGFGCVGLQSIKLMKIWGIWAVFCISQKLCLSLAEYPLFLLKFNFTWLVIKKQELFLFIGGDPSVFGRIRIWNFVKLIRIRNISTRIRNTAFKCFWP